MSIADYRVHKPTLDTERLILRRMVASDVDALREWTADKGLYAYWGKAAGKVDKNPDLLFVKPPEPTDSFHWGIQDRADDKIIGEMWVYLIENNRMAKVAFRISPRCHGRGYATEALRATVDFCFAHTELKRLWSDVDARNMASCRVLEKCCFQREGLIRQGKMVSSWCDYYVYGLLNTDDRLR